MRERTASRGQHRRTPLRERVESAARLDRDAGVILGVKVLSPDSRNGRQYPPDVIRKALPLYEGCRVFADHPDKPGKDRSSAHLLGYLRNARMDGDCARADLVLIRSHPLAASLMETAEDDGKARLWGLSHNALGETVEKGNVTVVTEITEVRSVDLVTNPATVSGLFESEGRMRLTEEIPGAGVIDEEAPLGDAPELPAAPEADDADPHAELTAGFKASMMAVFDDTSMDPKEKLAKLKKLVMHHHDIVNEDDSPKKKSGGDSSPKEESDDDGGDYEAPEESGDEEKDDKMKESKEPTFPLALLDLCESVKVPPTGVLVKALAGLKNDADRKALLEQWKGRTPPANNKPRTQTPSGGKAAGDDFFARLTSPEGN